MMTKAEHYRLLANAIKSQVDKFDDRRLDDDDDVWLAREIEYRRGVAETANVICGLLEGTDRTFDRDWFAAACGLYVSNGRDTYSDCYPNQLTWEQPRAIADPRGGVIAAREIRGAGVIDSAVAVVTKGPVAWIRGDRVRVRRGDHEGRTGTVTTRPPSSVRLSSIYVPYAKAGDGHVQVALDGEPGGSSVGPGARAAGGRGGIPVVVAAADLEPYEGPPGRGIRR